MRRQLNQKYICFVMALVMFVISATGVYHSACADELPVRATVAAKHEKSADVVSQIKKDCPSCPADNQSSPDRCDSTCHCPCHAPLMAQPVQIASSQQITPLLFCESFKALPEVYLSKFIPPHITA